MHYETILNTYREFNERNIYPFLFFPLATQIEFFSAACAPHSPEQLIIKPLMRCARWVGKAQNLQGSRSPG